MSEWKVEVVQIGKVEKHPNADRLEITNVHGGYPVIVGKGEFKEGDLVVYIPVDSIVDTNRKEFRFLASNPDDPKPVRIKAKRLCGVFSMGLLIPVRSKDIVSEGTDMSAVLGITKYEPDKSNRRSVGSGGGGGSHGLAEKDPGFMPEYTDLEGMRKWPSVMQDLEDGQVPVIISEKTHGSNARYLYRDGRLWVGSRHQIRRPPHKVTSWGLLWYKAKFALWFIVTVVLEFFCLEAIIRGPSKPRRPFDVKSDHWWDVAIRLNLEEKLKQAPGIVLYGEIYGPVQDLKYGSPNQISFRAFDALDSYTKEYLDHDEFVELTDRLGIERVPQLYRGPWKEELRALAEGKTAFPGADHVREGFVLKPLKEVDHPRLGRVILKLVGQGYLLR